MTLKQCPISTAKWRWKLIVFANWSDAKISTLKYQHWFNVMPLTLFQHQISTAKWRWKLIVFANWSDVKISTLIQRWNINIEMMLKIDCICKSFWRWHINFDSTLKYQRWFNVMLLTFFKRQITTLKWPWKLVVFANRFDVKISTLIQRHAIDRISTSDINVEMTLKISCICKSCWRHNIWFDVELSTKKTSLSSARATLNPAHKKMFGCLQSVLWSLIKELNTGRESNELTAGAEQGFSLVKEFKNSLV